MANNNFSIKLEKMQPITKKEAHDNIKSLIDVCVKNGNIFEGGAAVLVMIQSLEVLSAEPEIATQKEG